MQIHRKNTSNLIDRLILSFGFVLLLLSSSISYVRSAPYCYGEVDLLFVVDASYSIKDQDFTVICNFISSLYSAILRNGGAGGNLHAGVIMYASTVYTDHRMIQLGNESNQLLPRLKLVKRDLRNTNTNTAAGLDAMYDMIRQYGRTGSTKVAILLTDGISNDRKKTKNVAKKIKEDRSHDIFMISIGIGNADDVSISELRSIASNTESVLMQADLAQDTFLLNILKKVCAETLDKKRDPEVEKEDLAMDVVFMIPESIFYGDFEIIKEFILAIMQRFKISANFARVGFIKYGESELGGRHSISPADITMEADFTAALYSLTRNVFNENGNAVGKALERLNWWVDGFTDPDRPVAAVLLTPRMATDPDLLMQQMQTIRKQMANRPKVYLNVLGIGTNTDTWEFERMNMAHSDSTSFHVDNFLGITGEDDLSVKLIDDIAANIRRIGKGTIDTAGPGAIDRWNVEFDVLFLIDGSTLVSSPAYQVNIIKFVVKELNDEFKLYTADSPTGGRVGLKVFDSTGIYNEIQMGNYTDREDLNRKIDSLSFITRTRVADTAIAVASMDSLIDEGREPAAQLSYLITMSQSGYPLLVRAIAHRLAENGIQVMVIGVGDGISQSELDSTQLFDGGRSMAFYSPLPSLASASSLERLRNDLRQYAAIDRPTGFVFRWETPFDFIVLLHDEAGRYGGGIQVKNFLQEVFSKHDIGQDGVRVGVITFGAMVNQDGRKIIMLGQDSYLGSLVAKLFLMTISPTGGPNVEAAFDEMRRMFNIAGRPGVPKVVLLITQGISIPDSLDTKIQNAKKPDPGIRIATLGIGAETNQIFMERIATNKDLAFQQMSWSPVFTPEMDAGLIALALGQVPPETPLDILRLPSQCSQRVAIMFVIDTSESIESHLGNIKAFVAALMSGFDLSTVQIGALRFAGNVDHTSVIMPGEVSTYIELYLSFNDRIQIGTDGLSTATDLAIEYVKTNIFENINGVEKICVLVTDGNSRNTEDTLTIASEARAAGIYFIAIGVGQLIEPELIGITGNPDLYFGFTGTDFTDSVKLQAVQEKICILARPGECGAGRFRDSQFLCQDCGLGTYQPKEEEQFCTSCPLGTTTTTPGAQNMAECRSQCPVGTKRESGSCVECPVGFYQDEINQDTCKVCPTNRNKTPFPGATSSSQCTANICLIDMDMIMIVDGTSSISVQQLALVKAFAIRQLPKFVIAPSRTRVGVIRIGSFTGPEDVFSLTKSTSENAVIGAIHGVRGGASSTNTASALFMARKEFTDNGRPDLPKVIVLVTDGISAQPEQTLYQALLARERGFQILAVGIGESLYETELKAIAGNNVIMERSFNRLPTMDITPQICEAARIHDEPTQPPNAVCGTPMDLLIILDLSESAHGSLTFLKAGLSPFLRTFPTNANDGKLTNVRIGMFGYDVDIHTNKWIRFTDDVTAVINKIFAQFPDQSKSGTNTHKALDQAATWFKEDGDNSTQNVVMIFTDGISDLQQETKRAASRLRDKHIYTVAISYGNNDPYMSGLENINTAGKDSLIIFEDNAVGSKFTERVKQGLCIDSFVCSYRLDIVFILDISAQEDIFIAELSKRFPQINAFVIKVGPLGAANLSAAIEASVELLSPSPTPETVLTILINTDKSLPINRQSLRETAQSAKSKGIRIMVANAGDSLPESWGEIASSPQSVFPKEYLNGLKKPYLAWFLCPEPCESGYELKADGVCGECDIGYYRDRTESYRCTLCNGTTTTTTTGSKSPSQCIISICDIPMDLMLLIDASDSIGQGNFGLLKATLWSLIDKFVVGLNDEQTRVAFVKIGQVVWPDSYVRLADSTDATTVKTRIISLRGEEPQTNTADSIAKMVELYKQDGRPGVPWVAVVITDGRSINSFQTKLQAALAHLLGISIIGVVVGDNVFMDEIKAIASTPQDVQSFESFRALFNYNKLHIDICDVARNYVPPDKIVPPDPLSGNCSTRMDLVVVLDGSNGVTGGEFTRMQTFVINMIERLDIGLTKIRVGILTYSDGPHVENLFPLDSSLNLLSVREGVLSQTQRGSPRRDTVMALERAINMIVTATERKGVGRSIILIKAGQTGSLPDLRLRAIEAKNAGVQIVPISYGDTSTAMNHELEVIATDQDLAIQLTSLSDLNINNVTQLICPAHFHCTAAVEIYMIWDLSGIDSITRAEKFMEILKTEFTEATIGSVFIDHVESVAEGVTQGLDLLLASQMTFASRILLVISDKVLPQTVKDQLQAKTAMAKDSGISTVVIDALAGSNSLDQVASYIQFSHRAPMFDVLPHSALIKQSLCTAPCSSGSSVSLTNNGVTCLECPKDTYKDAMESFVCIPCSSGETTSSTGSTSVTKCNVGACASPMDIVYVIDASQSISIFEFNTIKAFLINTLSKYDIGLHRVAVITFSSVVHNVFDLNACVDKVTLLNYVYGLTQINGGSGTNTADAIKTARDILMAQGRLDAFRSIAILTDGISSNSVRTIEASRKAQKAFYRVIGVGIGQDAYMPEIIRLSSRDSYKIISSFIQLATTTDFVEFTCEDTYMCSKDMDIIVLHDHAPGISPFKARLMDFESKFQLSHNSQNMPFMFTEYVSQSDLETKIDTTVIDRIRAPPANVKVVIFIVQNDLDQESTKNKVISLRNEGAVVAFIKANLNLDNRNFVSLVSNSGLLFETDRFNEPAFARHIERQTCIDPCPQGQVRAADGSCELMACPAGQARPPGDTTCILDCGPGTYINGGTCTECAIGKFQPARFSTGCDDCASPLTTATTGSTSQDECIVSCGPGTRRSTDGRQCIDCPQNFYQPGSHQTSCMACPVNLRTSGTRSTSLSDCQGNCSISMDVIFLVDGSTSVGLAQFQLIKAFIVRTMTSFVIGTDDTRFGIVTFADNVIDSPKLELKDSVSRAAATDTARRLIQGAKPGTNMHDALKASGEMFVSQGKEERAWRVILISDGIPDNIDQAKGEATKLKKQFVHITCLGVGTNAYLPLLRSIATNPTEVIYESNFIGLATRNILPDICGTDPCEHPMDVYLYNLFPSDGGLQQKIGIFRSQMETKFPNSIINTVSSFQEVVVSMVNPSFTKSLVLFTNQPDGTGIDTDAINEIKARGFVVSVIYNSFTDSTYLANVIVSDPDLLFNALDFHLDPFSEYILRALCIAPCGVGTQRDPEGQCSDCERGTYRGLTEQYCVYCASGQTTNNEASTSVAACINCVPNKWLCPDMTCIDLVLYCDGTNDCVDGSDEICNNCDKGTYWNENDKMCVACEKGTFTDKVNQTSCDPCPAGSSTLGTGTSSLAGCDVTCDVDGEELNAEGTGCTPCETGYFRSVDRHLVCYKCPKHYITIPGIPAVTMDDCVADCQEGEAMIDGQCEICPPIFYQPEKHQKECLRCPEGMASADNRKTCFDPCPAGKHFVIDINNQVAILGGCQDCPEDTFATAEMTLCQACPIGHVAPGTGNTKISDCMPNCGSGSYLSTLQQSCFPCPIGEYQPNAHQLQCESCPPGKTTMDVGQTQLTDCKDRCDLGEEFIVNTCEPCDIGFYRDNPNDVSCTGCQNGWTTPTTGANSRELCIPICPAGEKRIDKSCVPCELGSYNTEEGQDSCMPCEKGFTTPVIGADSPNLCQDLCESGSELTSRVPFTCTLCTKDHYRKKNVDNMCVKCDNNFVTLNEGSESKSDCLANCSSGHGLDTATQQCAPCKKGTFQPLPYQKTCPLCPLGQTTIGIGKTSLTDCISDCNPGTRADSNSECVDCGYGYFQPDPSQTFCYPCPAGTTTTVMTATLQDQCIDPCPGGYELPVGKTQCKKCPKDTYKDETLDTQCQQCPPGRFTDGLASTRSDQCKEETLCDPGFKISGTQCMPCGIGEYQDQPNQDACIECPSATTTDDFQSDSLDDCKATTCSADQFTCTVFQCIDESLVCNNVENCGDGSDELDQLCATQCPAGQRVVGDSCEPCPDGTYQPNPNQDVCFVCPQNGFTGTTGATSPTDCFDCTEGTYYTGSRCENCPVGEFQDDINQWQCEDCPERRITAQTGSSQSSSCISCPPGFDFTPGDTQCRRCPVNSAKGNGQTKCTPCPPGFVTLTIGSAQCLADCNAGTFWNEAVSRCEPCPLDEYQSSRSQSVCIPCEKGLGTFRPGADSLGLCIDKCPGGTEYNNNSKDCNVCRQGYFRERRVDLLCRPCSPGFTTDPAMNRATSQDYCVPNCLEGGFRNNAGSCEACAHGFYQNQKYQTSCKKCPNGTITINQGSVSITDCQDRCGAGEELQPGNNGAYVCSPCPIGQFKQPPLTTVCVHCKEGYTTPNIGSTQCVSNCQEGSFATGQGCKLCPAGTFQKDRYQDSCEPCAAGLYTTQEGATSVNDCIDICQNGTELRFDGSCRPCVVSFYRTQNVDMTCQPCPGSSFTRTEGAISIIECLPFCFAGNFGDIFQPTCTPCQAGFYQNRNFQKECNYCGDGQTTLDSTNTIMVTGATSKSQCHADCLEGEMVMEGTNNQCVPCPRGTYQDRRYQEKCIPCPNGTSTLDVKSDELSDCYDPCENGYTLNPDTKECDPCGFDRHRDRDISMVCLDCPAGFFTDTNTATQCQQIICPAGTVFDGETCATEDCGPGRFFDPGSSACTDCPPGTFQDSVNERSCIRCQRGTSSDTASDGPGDCKDPCDNGLELPLNGRTSADCIPCRKGWYKTVGQSTVCVRCPPEYTTHGPGSTNVGQCVRYCKSGSKINANNDGCDLCEYATYQPEELQTSCLPCDVGFSTEYMGAGSFSECKNICNSGFELQPDKRTCMECPIGAYRDKNNNAMCVPCDQGQTTATIASPDASSCIWDCKEGHYHNTATEQCVQCSVGFYQPAPYQTECIQCPSWLTTFVTGAVSVTQCYDPCVSGRFRNPDNGKCELCPRGKYRKQHVHDGCQDCGRMLTTLGEGQDSFEDCVSMCGPGTHYSFGSQGCVQCEPNTFNPLPYQFECIPCPPKYPFNEDDFLDCKKECPPGETWNRLRKACNWCAKGFYRPSATADCTACPGQQTTESAGKYDIDDCIPDCGPGQFWFPSTLTCQPCPPGTSQDTLQSHGLTSCVTCPADSFQPLTGQTSCQLCSSGSIATNDRTGCKTCTLGQFLDHNTVNCVACPQNTYQDSAQHIFDMCTPCSTGLYTITTGSTRASDCQANWCGPGLTHSGTSCVPCGIGLYKGQNDNSCIQCSNGRTTYSNVATSVSQCTDCALGQFMDRNTASCVACPQNTYQDSAQHIVETCTPCPTGLHTITTGSTSASDCQANWCGPGLTHSGTSCVPCGIGLYKGQNDNSCIQCSNGRTTYSNMATSVSQCTDCTLGQFLDRNTASCVACPLNTYQGSAQHIVETCTPCPTGLHTITTGSTSASDCQANWCGPGLTHSGTSCVPCGIGLYKGQNDNSCIQCSNGRTTYSNVATSVSQCTDCTLGQFLNRNTASCVACPKNTYQDSAQHIVETCTPCPTGLHTITTGSTSASDCQANWCPAGQSHMTGSCVDCGTGKYRGTGDPACIDCPVGTTTSTTTATSVNDCQQEDWCGAGREVRNGKCCNCMRGFFKPANSATSSCTPCPIGTTTSFVGSISQTQCTDPCRDGYQFVVGKGCIPCGIGRYKTRQVSPLCMPCPSGTTTKRLAACSVLECRIAHCHKCIDLLIVIDNSNNADQAELDQLKIYLKQLIDNFHVNSRDVRIGLIRYGTTVNQCITFQQGIDRNAIKTAIDAKLVVSTEPGADTAAALSKAREIVATRCRTKALKHVLLITDEVGMNIAAAKTQSDTIKALGGRIVVIGVNNPDVISLATGIHNHFAITDYRTLPRQSDVVAALC